MVPAIRENRPTEKPPWHLEVKIRLEVKAHQITAQDTTERGTLRALVSHQLRSDAISMFTVSPSQWANVDQIA